MFKSKATPKTVKSVYTLFVAELEEVVIQQQAIAVAASDKQEVLEEEQMELGRRIDTLKSHQVVAEAEVTQAKTGMEQIGRMFGIKL